MATFVLVHGAFQGGWVWQSVASKLRKEGHEVYTPTLTGSGEREHLGGPNTDLSTHIRDIANVVYFESLTNVVLVGHSYAGMVITAVADKLQGKISHLIYLDAVVPEDGKSLIDMAGPEFELLLGKHVTGEQVRPWPLEFFGIRCEEEKQWFTSKLTPFPLRAFDTAFRQHASNDSARRTTILCTLRQNQFIERIAAECRSKGWDSYEMETGHAPMVTAPDGLAALLSHIVSSPAEVRKRAGR